MGKDFIKKSLETKNIDIARKKRDEILAELDLLSKNASGEINITNNIDKSLDFTELNAHEQKMLNLRTFWTKMKLKIQIIVK